ncbi:MAG: hypothetical protein ACLU30_18030 [Odoribacter splanchnicus]
MEVAEHLQISINTVRTQLSRSLKFAGERRATCLPYYCFISENRNNQGGVAGIGDTNGIVAIFKKWDFLSHDLMGGGVICIKLEYGRRNIKNYGG